MTIRYVLLCLLLSLPLSLTAQTRPEFAELNILPTAGTLVVPMAGTNAPQLLDSTLTSVIESALQSSVFKGKSGESLVLYSVASYDKVVLLGLGEEQLSARKLRAFGGAVFKATGDKGSEKINVLWPDGLSDSEHPAAHVGFGLQLGGYRFEKYKSSPADEEQDVATVYTIYSSDSWPTAAYWHDNWSGVADGVYFARNLISEPANVIYPESFVDRTREAFKGVKNVSIKVMNVRQMEKLGMGALLGVGMGSERPPRLLIVQYKGGSKDEAPLAFVGKGVTFDSGGISLKNPKGMWRMKYDMSGAAAVTVTVLSLAKRKAPVNAVAVAALVENMPSERAQRPGDVRRSMSGKTIEVINTDAEGRLILSDAIWYAQEQFAPQFVVDVATLTGSIKVALGSAYAGVFSRQDEFAEQIVAAGVASGEEVWRMPLHEQFRKAIKSDIADIKNSVEGGYGGASTGAEFIGNFVKADTTWAHLDIAGKAWAFDATSTTPKGAAGWGVLLLNQLVLDHYQTEH